MRSSINKGRMNGPSCSREWSYIGVSYFGTNPTTNCVRNAHPLVALAAKAVRARARLRYVRLLHPRQWMWSAVGPRSHVW